MTYIEIDLCSFSSVHLARRVLQLEKINTLCKQDVEREKKKVLQLAEEVKLLVCNELLNNLKLADSSRS
jgi:hypothetical protein